MRHKLVKLGEICDFEGGSQPPKSNFIFEKKKNYIRFIQIRDFNSDKNLTYIPIAKKNRICKEDDILIGRYGASVGKILTGLSGAYNVALMKTKPNLEVLNKKFLYYYLLSNLFQEPLKNISERSAQNGFNKEDIYNFSIALPSLVEQQRIVAKLESVFAEIDKIINLTKERIIKEKNIKISILKSIFSNIKIQKTIGEIATVIAGQSPEGKYYNKNADGTPFYQGKKEFGDYELKKPTVWTTKISKVALKGDVLLSVRAPVGETNMNYDKICIGRGLAAIRVNNENNSEFIYYFLNSIKDHIVGNTGAVFNSINKKQIENIIIPTPSLDEQNQITGKIKQVLSHVKEINLFTKQKLHNLNILKLSILNKELINKAA